MARHTLTPVTTRAGQQLTVSVLPAGSTKLYRCDCGAKVGWVKSSKTDRWYLCGAIDSQNPDSDRVYVASWWAHNDAEHQKVLDYRKTLA